MSPAASGTGPGRGTTATCVGSRQIFRRRCGARGRQPEWRQAPPSPLEHGGSPPRGSIRRRSAFPRKRGPDLTVGSPRCYFQTTKSGCSADGLAYLLGVQGVAGSTPASPIFPSHPAINQAPPQTSWKTADHLPSRLLHSWKASVRFRLPFILHRRATSKGRHIRTTGETSRGKERPGLKAAAPPGSPAAHRGTDQRMFFSSRRSLYMTWPVSGCALPSILSLFRYTV